MVNEFDKEIDAMLRDLANGDSFAKVLPAPHLDADEISAFAENALPSKARLQTMEHLADCSKCRKFLANTVLLNSENKSEIIHEEVKSFLTLPAIPWYQKLFAFPQLAYTMGALALLLTGMVGLLVWQNSNTSESMVAQKEITADKPYRTGGASSDGEAPANGPYSANTASNASSIPANSAANSANSTANYSVGKDVVPMSPTSVSNSSAPLKSGEDPVLTDKLREESPEVATKSANQPTDLAKKEEAQPSATPTLDEDANSSAGAGRRELSKPNEVSQNSVVQNQQNISPDSRDVKRSQTATPPPATAGAVNEDEKTESKKAKKVAEKNDDDRKDQNVETRKIGGKTFRQTDGIWMDSSYPGGSTKTVKRGSNDYKKLDSGLQNIGNSLSGTVIVVWGGKNYKIQ